MGVVVSLEESDTSTRTYGSVGPSEASPQCDNHLRLPAESLGSSGDTDRLSLRANQELAAERKQHCSCRQNCADKGTLLHIRLYSR